MKKAFRFHSKQLDYTIKAKRASWLWWLLLLLLLPLLLLIRFEKNVYIKVVNAETKLPVSKAEVNFRYERSYVYDSGHFLTRTIVDSVATSDDRGIAGFVKLGYSLYSYIFKHGSPAFISAANNCYGSDTLIPAFHSLSSNDTLVLELHPLFISIDFKVVDKDDKQPLPGSTVQIISEVLGKQYTDSALTDPGGKVVFKHFPKCGKLAKVTAGLEGYYPDSIINKTADDLIGNVDDKRLLQLKPIRKPIEFFVVDCKSKEPIAGATVTIEFDIAGKKIVKTITTNVDGKGKGVYDGAHIIAKIHLKGSHDYYKDGELPGWHLVKDFINNVLYPPAKRTFCLEPDQNAITFINIDSLTGKPLANVLNTITINRNGTQIVKTSTSNRNGIFPVTIEKGDIVSILSQHPPDYEDNNTKVKNADAIRLLEGPQSGRTIPLKPKVFEKPPRESCRVFVSDCFLGDEVVPNWVSEIYKLDDLSEYVGEGIYPDNTLAFPKSGAGSHTFDGIAIDKNTRVIIYSGRDFQGDVVLDQKGPALIFNKGRLDGKNKLNDAQTWIDKFRTKQFKEPLQSAFPPSCRILSNTDMIDWGKGSMKVICNN